MKRSLFSTPLLVFLVFICNAQAQKRRVIPPQKPAFLTQKPIENANTAVVVDERLAVLRVEPSLYAKPIQRMRRGRVVSISGTKQADGVTFYRVAAMPDNFGWIQKEAVVGKFRRGDDERMVKLVQSFDGFDQIECATLFLDTFPASPLRPAILLLTGDLMEEIALKISQDATKKLDRREMAASGAPIHSFYLNYVSLDRYRKLGIGFTFNPNTKLLHYDGAAWREITRKFPNSNESVEAQKRLDLLKVKMEKTQ